MNLPKFGSVEEETVKPDGTISKDEIVYAEGRPPGKYRHYKYRVRVTSAQEEMTEVLRFAEEKAGCVWSGIEYEGEKDFKSKGYYYVIKKWTEKME